MAQKIFHIHFSGTSWYKIDRFSGRGRTKVNYLRFHLNVRKYTFLDVSQSLVPCIDVFQCVTFERVLRKDFRVNFAGKFLFFSFTRFLDSPYLMPFNPTELNIKILLVDLF